MSFKDRSITRFAAFRSGGGFIAALGVFVTTWLAINWGVTYFDPDDLKLNLILSIEAAFAMPVILMEQARQGSVESERLKAVLEATHEMIRLLKGVAEDVEGIEEKVADD